MKLALIAAVACMALSVESLNWAKYVGAPETERSKGTYTSFLPYFVNRSIPVVDVQSTDLICRSPDMTATVTPYQIGAGEMMRIEWDVTTKNSPYSDTYPIGPCSFWLAPFESKGVGRVWSKIREQGWDTNHNGMWCSQQISFNGNFYDLTIPSGIKAGKYILRVEIIDLLDAATPNYDDFTMGPRFHPNCLVLDITGKGADPLKNPVSILEVYKPFYKVPFTKEGKPNSSIKVPGPAPYPAENPAV